MFGFIDKLFFVYTYDEEIEELLEKQKRDKIKADIHAKKDNLQLCLDHQPRSPGSHYASHNCDHCRLIEELEEARDYVIPTKRV